MLSVPVKCEAGQVEGTTAISYQDIEVAYVSQAGTSAQALIDVSFEVKKGSFTSIIGPSGCGKTTLIRLAAGFQEPSTGLVQCNGKVVTGLNHEVGYVTQQSKLYPWMTTRENVEFALEVRGVAREERRRRSDEYLSAMGLSEFAENYPHQLSGGMQKRACIAQTLIYEPAIILMDEPFAGLDAQTRMSVESDLLGLWTQLRPTIVFVTHDLAEAIALSDEVVVMSERPGRLKAVFDVPLARPRDVYEVQADPHFSEAYQQLWDDFRLRAAPAVGLSSGGAGFSGRRRLARAPRRISHGVAIRLWQLGFLVVTLGLWQLLADVHVLDPLIFSNPISVVKTLGTMLSGQAVEQRVIYPQVATTLSEMAAGFAIGSAVSIAVGITLARNRFVAEIVEPFILVWFGIPIITIAPLFVLLLGIGFNSKAATALVATFFVVFFQTYGGVKSLDEEYFLLARLMGASRLDQVRKVLIPGALPFIFLGLRMGVPVAMTGAIVGEFIASSQGLGSFILNASSSFDAPATFAGLVIVVVIVAVCGQLVRLGERLLVGWMPAGR